MKAFFGIFFYVLLSGFVASSATPSFLSKDVKGSELSLFILTWPGLAVYEQLEDYSLKTDYFTSDGDEL